MNARTPLHHACENGSLSIVETLLEKNVDLNCIDHFGQTPLILAVRSDNFLVVECLLKTNTINSIVIDKHNTHARRYARSKKVRSLVTLYMINNNELSESLIKGVFFSYLELDKQIFDFRRYKNTKKI